MPLDSREMAWFSVPTRDSSSGPEAEVRADFGGSSFSWKGKVTRMEAEVDQTSRMVHVVVEVQRPYDSTLERPALLPGTFADVTIFGRTLADVVAVPRHAVHEGNTVWVFNDGAMDIREVEVARSDREFALVTSGLGSGDLIVLTPLDAVTHGMALRLGDGDAKAEPGSRSGSTSETEKLQPNADGGTA